MITVWRSSTCRHVLDINDLKIMPLLCQIALRKCLKHLMDILKSILPGFSGHTDIFNRFNTGFSTIMHTYCFDLLCILSILRVLFDCV